MQINQEFKAIIKKILDFNDKIESIIKICLHSTKEKNKYNKNLTLWLNDFKQQLDLIDANSNLELDVDFAQMTISTIIPLLDFQYEIKKVLEIDIKEFFQNWTIGRAFISAHKKANVKHNRIVGFCPICNQYELLQDQKLALHSLIPTRAICFGSKHLPKQE